MKPVRRADSTSQSCSCTSCLYKSESEQLSIRKYIARGSRISRLYFGKYIPLREQKLLNRLVRTRAVYDDLRARLISDSTLSLDKNADLRPGRQHNVIKPVDSQKSGAILEIVDIIDKGAPLGPNLAHSECCSCCSCSTKSKIIDRTKKEPKRKKAYEREHEEKYGETRLIGTGEGAFAKRHERKYGKAAQVGKGEEVYARTYEKKYGRTGQTGTGEGYYEAYEREFAQTVPGRTGDRYNKRDVRFKAKKIRSEPCTCTLKFSGLIKKHSKAMLKKLRPLQVEEPFLGIEEQYVVEESKKQNLARKSLQKYKDLRSKLDQDLKKLNVSKANLKKNLKLRAKKSIEQVKEVKNKLKNNLESGVRKSIQAVKSLRPKDKALESVESPEEETTFQIKKDSLVKFKDHLKRKQMMKDWECDIECEPDTCVPDECFKIIKLRRHRGSRKRDRKIGARYEMVQREIKVGGASLSKSSSAVQAEQLATTTATRTKKHKPNLRVEGTKQVMEKPVELKTKEVKKGSTQKDVKGVAEISDIRSAVPATYGESALYDIKKKSHINEENETLKGREHIAKKSHSRGRQAVRINSSFSFDLEFYKKPREANMSRTRQPSGIYMHAPRRRRKKVHHRHESTVKSKSSLESSQGTSENYSTRLVQTDRYTKPHKPKQVTAQQRRIITKDTQCECEKRLSSVKTNTHHGTKSESSVNTHVATRDKNISKEIRQRRHSSQVSLLSPGPPHVVTSEINESHSENKQAVRIGSTFSFSVEFYKKGAQNELTSLKTPSITEQVEPTRSKNRLVERKLMKTRSRDSQVARRLVQVKGTSAKAYNRAKSTLNRCFCTLKRQGRIKTKKKFKTSKIATEPPEPSMVDRYVETKKYRYEPPKLADLLPYQCEPGICIPDECDPILCQKIIDMRKRRYRRGATKSVGSYTGSRKTKSTSSIVSRPFTSARTKTVQSSIVPTKVAYTNVPRRYKNVMQDFDRNKMIKADITSTERQAVRIGSTFSFNIEFYKNKQDPVAEMNRPSLLTLAPRNDYEQPKYKERGHNKRHKALFTQVINMDKYVGPSLKRCFCTLKLYKHKATKNKEQKKVKNFTVDTQTFGDVPITELVNRGTKTKREHRYKLLPYECEPYTCVPGECDPYICLQNIRKRELHTRNISAFTDGPEMRSISSLTENSLNKSEAVLVQPKLYGKGTKMRADYLRTLDNTARSPREVLKASNSKQAVRIGSSFNFSIEFSKTSPGEVTLTKYPKLKQPSNEYSRMNRDKGIKVTKVRVEHADTQAIPRKVNRSALVRPMLKRCFCTLNLQKKNKLPYQMNKQETKYFGPNYYTIARATTTKTQIISRNFRKQQFEPKNKIISLSTSSFLLNKSIKRMKSRNESMRLYSSFKLPIKFKEPVYMKSSLSIKLDIVRQLSTPKESMARFLKQPLKTFNHALIKEETHESFKLFKRKSVHSIEKVTSISRYLEQCFYTMNVRISNVGLKKKNTKLKPYECEPGICVPGECDPYECRKLIMKRLAKNVHKGSGTNSKSILNSATSTARSLYRNKQKQTHFRSRSQVTVPQRYRTLRHREPTGKQAVRIKSSFSFDLEFYKHQSQPAEKYMKNYDTSSYVSKPTHRITYGSPGKGVQVYGNKHYKHTQLQSGVDSVHQGTSPMNKRCFCTLKLQKKGKVHGRQAKLNNVQARQSPSITSRSIKIGTNAKYQGIPIDSNDLKFYECEPGICVPGQCDPYKCLELMKRRRHLGINTNQIDAVSFGSMTSDEKRIARAVGPYPLRTHHKSTEPFKYMTGIQKDNSHISGRSSRPAVRIGSNFSFNIEFYKDNPQSQLYTDTVLQKRTIPHSDSIVTKGIRDRRELGANVSPSKRHFTHKAIATENPLYQEAAITASFMKRCFCTKNLQSGKVSDEKNKKSFKDRCFCLLGLNKKTNKEVVSTGNPLMRGKNRKKDRAAKKVVETAEKVTNTNFRHKVVRPHLEPYECEPGICIPGQCNPYLCEKLIQKRLAKQHSKKSATEAAHTQSVSSSFGNYRPKNERTQAQDRTYQKQIQYATNEVTPSGKILSNTDKRLVRIGSNFSFNIEFFKENVSGSAMKEPIKEVKTYTDKDLQYRRIGTGMASKSIATETASIRDNKVQVKINPRLKPCFCTMKLLNKEKNNRTGKADPLVTKPAIQTRTVETQSHKRLKGLQNNLGGELLSPYECEPYVCVPGQCDPVECLKRIKRRQYQTKNFGTITKYPKRKSIGSVSTRMRNENFQVDNPYLLTNKGVQKTNYVSISGLPSSYSQPSQPRQAVRIGSNFSFNIEFFKEVGNGLPTVVTDRPQEELNTQRYMRKIAQHHTNTNPTYFKNMDSQVVPRKFHSTETAMAHLKRCFCTLPLRNKNLGKEENANIKIQSDQPRSDHSSIGSFLKKCVCTLKLNKLGKQNQQPKPALKYEVKGTSTYRARQLRPQKPYRMLEPYECEPFTCVPGQCDPYECLKRIQRRQVRDIGTGYKRNLKDSATDSIRQPKTRSTKAQYRQRRRLNSRGTSLRSKRTRLSKETASLSYQPSDNPTRQVVRIGSNFSFNIEFFKDNMAGDTEHKGLKAERMSNYERKGKRQTKSSSTGRRRLCDGRSQCSRPRRNATSAANIAPQRCFCTLKLLKKPNQHKPVGKAPPPTLQTKDKMTGTKVKYAVPQELGVYECPPLMCIPGECNPYECLEKIKRRRKSRNVGTRATRTSVASVGNRSLSLRARKIQSYVAKKRNIYASTPYSEPQSEILKSPPIVEHLSGRNKGAVRIGSNFNFNVEFFKQKLQPAVITAPKIIKARDIERDSQSYQSKNVTAGARNFRHTQMDGIKLKDQASDAGNLLKRCFCTLQLQKQNHQPRNNLPYPQRFVVGRVAVEPYMNTKIVQSKRTDKARSTSIDPKLLSRTQGTKTDAKFLKNAEFPLSQCNPNSCPEYQKRILRGNHGNDMQTILPFTPSKFYRKQSKTFISDNKKLNTNHFKGEIVGNPSEASMLRKGRRRLTAKKSKKSIPMNSLEIKPHCKDSFLCRCARFFFRRSDVKFEGSDTQEYNNHRGKPSETLHQSAKIKLTIPPKKAKSFGENCPYICPENSKDTGDKYSKSQSGDTENDVTSKMKKITMFNNNKSKGRGGEKIVTFADTSEYVKNKMFKGKKNKMVHSKRNTPSKLCYSCSANDCPVNIQKISGDFERREKSIKSNKKAASYSESVDDCQYCVCCKRKIDTDEISKGGGDRRSTISSRNKENFGFCPCDNKFVVNVNDRNRLKEKSTSDKLSRKYTMKKDKCCSEIKPVFEMQLDSASHDIINKGELKKKIDELHLVSIPSPKTSKTKRKSILKRQKSRLVKKEHHDFCPCCKCIRKHKAAEKVKPQGAEISVAAKGAKVFLGKFGKTKAIKNIIFTKTPKPATKISKRPKVVAPCICGSKPCATVLKQMRSDKLSKETMRLGKTCVCGSRICASESKRIKREKQLAIKKARSKAQSLINKKEREEVLRRTKIEDKKDKIRKKKRIKHNKELESQVKKYKNASDITLAIDSLADIGRFGLSSLSGAARYTSKALIDPKVACAILCRRCRKKDPELLMKELQQEYLDSDAASTLRRLQMRCTYMKRVQEIKKKLEENPVTHFILHAADKNWKTRQFKRKPVRRVREPLDFECSLYMATLRKRPYLSVYYKWPWFYPHFITMLNIWRQFTDIMLFLVAAVVWSPCILCMEGCRALMCCFFCTG